MYRKILWGWHSMFWPLKPRNGENVIIWKVLEICSLWFKRCNGKFIFRMVSLFWDRIILVGFLHHVVFYFIAFRIPLNVFEASQMHMHFHSFIHSLTIQLFIHSSFHLFIQQIVIEPLFYALPCAKLCIQNREGGT